MSPIAAFGSEISGPILGYVIPLASFTTECPATNVSDSHLYTSMNTGCPKLCVDGPHQPDPSESWIALVQRGKCEFVSKVREAQRLGARAVVVGGQDPEVSGLPDTLVNMYSTGACPRRFTLGRPEFSFRGFLRCQDCRYIHQISGLLSTIVLNRFL